MDLNLYSAYLVFQPFKSAFTLHDIFPPFTPIRGAKVPPGLTNIHTPSSQPRGTFWGEVSCPRTHRHGLAEPGIEPPILFCLKDDPDHPLATVIMCVCVCVCVCMWTLPVLRCCIWVGVNLYRSIWQLYCPSCRRLDKSQSFMARALTHRPRL